MHPGSTLDTGCPGSGLLTGWDAPFPSVEPCLCVRLYPPTRPTYSGHPHCAGWSGCALGALAWPTWVCTRWRLVERASEYCTLEVRGGTLDTGCPGSTTADGLGRTLPDSGALPLCETSPSTATDLRRTFTVFSGGEKTSSGQRTCRARPTALLCKCFWEHHCRRAAWAVMFNDCV